MDYKKMEDTELYELNTNKLDDQEKNQDQIIDLAVNIDTAGKDINEELINQNNMLDYQKDENDLATIRLIETKNQLNKLLKRTSDLKQYIILQVEIFIMFMLLGM